MLQYEMLAENPYTYTQEDVLFNIWLQCQPTLEKSEADVAQLRDAFFAKPQACLRTSPLPKKFGWGLVFAQDGKVALCPMESKEYQELLAGNRVKVLKAMRSTRA